MNSPIWRRPSTVVIATATAAKPTAQSSRRGDSGELLFDFCQEGVEEAFESIAVEGDFLARVEAQHRALGIELDPARHRHHRALLGDRFGDHAHLVDRVPVASFDLRIAQREPAVERRHQLVPGRRPGPDPAQLLDRRPDRLTAGADVVAVVSGAQQHRGTVALLSPRPTPLRDWPYPNSITLRIPSWASISSNPRLTSSRLILWEMKGSTSISPAIAFSTKTGTWSRPLTPP